MTPEQERWAEALWVLNEHGPQAEAFVAKRIVDLANRFDIAGVERWEAIAHRLASQKFDLHQLEHFHIER